MNEKQRGYVNRTKKKRIRTPDDSLSRVIGDEISFVDKSVRYECIRADTIQEYREIQVIRADPASSRKLI